MTFKLAITAVTFIVYDICLVISVEHKIAHYVRFIVFDRPTTCEEYLNQSIGVASTQNWVFLKRAALSQDKLEEVSVGIGQTVNQLSDDDTSRKVWKRKVHS